MNRFIAVLIVPLLLSAVPLTAGEPLKKEVVPVEEDHWKFTLAVPGWMPGVEGTIGIGGIDSHVDMEFKDLINKINMIWATRAEASKGRFGIMGELIYLSASDSLGVGGPLQKVDERLDEYLGDFSLRWRVIENERGYVDLLAGVRYTNLYQSLHLQSNDAGVGQTSADIVDNVDGFIRDRFRGLLSDAEFRNALLGALDDKLIADLDGSLRPDPERRTLAIGPLGAREPLRTALQIQQIVTEEEARLRDEVRALALRGAVRVAEVRRRIAAAKSRMEDRIAEVLDKQLNRTFAQCDYWWDPYIGVRARYNFSPSVYFTVRGEIGGFGIGSDLMWQAEAAFGVQLTSSIFAEAGYRALSFDYDRDGLTYDTITHGAQVTVGVEF